MSKKRVAAVAAITIGGAVGVTKAYNHVRYIKGRSQVVSIEDLTKGGQHFKLVRFADNMEMVVLNSDQVELYEAGLRAKRQSSYVVDRMAPKIEGYPCGAYPAK